jgi:hypothetical protein
VARDTTDTVIFIHSLPEDKTKHTIYIFYVYVLDMVTAEVRHHPCPSGAVSILTFVEGKRHQ